MFNPLLDCYNDVKKWNSGTLTGTLMELTKNMMNRYRYRYRYRYSSRVPIEIENYSVLQQRTEVEGVGGSGGVFQNRDIFFLRKFPELPRKKST